VQAWERDASDQLLISNRASDPLGTKLSDKGREVCTPGGEAIVNVPPPRHIEMSEVCSGL
jgi:hypothetical protein